MDDKKEEQNRITMVFSKETDEQIRDVSLILGLKVSELVSRAVDKYVEAVEKQIGPKFTQAIEGIKAVRELQADD